MKRYVFGCGGALYNNWEIIKNEYNPEVILDNNPAKWGKTDVFTGLKCTSPEELESSEDCTVLITVGDPYAVNAIKKQLEKYEIKVLELAKEQPQWMGKKGLPDSLIDVKNSADKRIILLNTPEHDNIGDHLIALAMLEYLKTYFGDFTIIEVSDREYESYHDQLKNYIKASDILIISGGGFLGSLWLYNGELNVRSILKEYPDNRVIVFPQTLFFEDNERGKKEFSTSQKIYSESNNLILFARENESYNLAKESMNLSDNVYLFPDFALFSEFKQSNTEVNNKKKVLVCLRKDKERILDNESQNHVLETLQRNNWEVEFISMHADRFFGKNDRKRIVENKLRQIESADLVVTDTLHCMISSAVTGTPCIAFNNSTGKVHNVWRWVENLGYIKKCDSADAFPSVLMTVENRHFIYELKDREKYLNRIKKIINEE